MSLKKELDALESKYYGEWEEEREPAIAALAGMHREAAEKGLDAFRKFSEAAMDICGGIYIPYIFWRELREYMSDEENRTRLHAIVERFTESGFEQPEMKKMKPLLITYYSTEKPFEVDKVQTLVVAKSHPSVQEYFRKILAFVEKNKTSVDMYIEKFDMLKDNYPDFDLLRMPVIKLKEKLASA